MNESESTSIYDFLHDLTEQLTGKFTTMSRPMIIHIQTDYNSTDLHPKQIEYAIKEFKEQIETSFFYPLLFSCKAAELNFSI